MTKQHSGRYQGWHIKVVQISLELVVDMNGDTLELDRCELLRGPLLNRGCVPPRERPGLDN